MLNYKALTGTNRSVPLRSETARLGSGRAVGHTLYELKRILHLVMDACQVIKL